MTDKRQTRLDQAVEFGSITQTSVVSFLCNNGMAVRDFKRHRIDDEQDKGGRAKFTHLSLDGAGGGVFSIPWSHNQEFMETYVASLQAFEAVNERGPNY